MSTVDLGTGQEELFSNEECQFAYRTSVFKTELQQKCLIKGVTLILKKEASPNITYSGLSAKLQNGKVWSNKEWLGCQQLAVFWFLRVKQTDKFVTISEHIQANLSLFDIRKAVGVLRREKLPDTNRVGNAGSFFKNPIISKQHFNCLNASHPTMPFFNIGEEHKVKVSGGWLIEKSDCQKLSTFEGRAALFQFELMLDFYLILILQSN